MDGDSSDEELVTRYKELVTRDEELVTRYNVRALSPEASPVVLR